MGGTDDALGRLKRWAGLTAAPTGSYRCRSCDEAFDVQYHVCPKCGGYSVEPDGE
jgi:hypothetical protein